MSVSRPFATRSESWNFLDLATKVQFPSGVQAPRILLWFLAKAGNNGFSFHGYRSIMSHTGLSKDGISRAAKYLRELGILTWESGGGGAIKRQTNRYQLHLDAMKELISRQGVFDPETGKLLEHSQSSPAGKTSGKCQVVSAGSKSALLEPSVKSSQQGEILSNQHSVSGTQNVNNSFFINSKKNNHIECSVPVRPLKRVEFQFPYDLNTDRIDELEMLRGQVGSALNGARKGGSETQDLEQLLQQVEAKLDEFRCAHDSCLTLVSTKGGFCFDHRH